MAAGQDEPQAAARSATDARGPARRGAAAGRRSRRARPERERDRGRGVALEGRLLPPLPRPRQLPGRAAPPAPRRDGEPRCGSSAGACARGGAADRGRRLPRHASWRGAASARSCSRRARRAGHRGEIADRDARGAEILARRLRRARMDRSPSTRRGSGSRRWPRRHRRVRARPPRRASRPRARGARRAARPRSAASYDRAHGLDLAEVRSLDHPSGLGSSAASPASLGQG